MERINFIAHLQLSEDEQHRYIDDLEETLYETFTTADAGEISDFEQHDEDEVIKDQLYKAAVFYCEQIRSLGESPFISILARLNKQNTKLDRFYSMWLPDCMNSAIHQDVIKEVSMACAMDTVKKIHDRLTLGQRRHLRIPEIELENAHEPIPNFQ